MFIGGCAGSTGGGIKVLRIMILLKQGSVEVKRLLHPRAVIPVRIDGRTVAPSVVASVFGFMLIYIGLLVISTLAMTAMGLDLITAFSGVAASIGNIGPGLGAVGPAAHYAYIPVAGKWLLSFCCCRASDYALLVIFTLIFEIKRAVTS